ncbi:recombinase family protein [Burkholderia vietnamiensis]|uniref:Resolvase n=1 Tax=Burkholderia vietnamiensis TaxID=60552 RepID=A0AA45B9V6_BURVI|nr:recombinase family protein [Burkholderia vietnamiensis]MCA7988920.1 recombinase family protein [Burkholderia vietnamiensis]MCA8194078.1 recombinase family protein [Burkholderia vietnamiensis]MCA8210305.1 recombinase family protein [Burkholderia vietnamiensis]PRH38550.1 resolvase [Burkholderia vietnamiensis]
MAIRAYLRASTVDQNADRARETLMAFAAEHGVKRLTFYTENASGAKLRRAELDRLIDESEPGDVLLVEGIDRLSRLTQDDWETLKRRLRDTGLLIVAKYVPMTWDVLDASQKQRVDWSHDAIRAALRDLMIELAAAKAREDYEVRRERAAQGIAQRRARDAAGLTDSKGYAGRKADADMHRRIVDLRQRGMSYSQIADTLKTTRPTIARALRAAGLLREGTAE